jgi:hypothetical protein
MEGAEGAAGMEDAESEGWVVLTQRHKDAETRMGGE